MAHPTNISWTDYATNPIRTRRVSDGKRGWWCSHVSPGCEHCYSEVLNRRWGHGIDYKAQNADLVEFYLDEKELKSWDKIPAGSKVFVCDMTDLFHERIPDEMIRRVWSAMALHPDITFQVLTKRAKRMRRWVNELIFPYRDNIQLGVSVEDQDRADERIPELMETHAVIHFLSCEPLLGALRIHAWLHERGDGTLGQPQPRGTRDRIREDHPEWFYKVDWVIVGGESGTNFRPMEPSWARSLRDQCQAAGTAFFYKQGSGRLPGRDTLLDGVEWHEWPNT